MGETPQEREQASSDVIFCGVKNGTSSNGLVRIIDPTGTHADSKTGTWFRPNVGSVGSDLARFQDGERVLLRVAADVIVKATAPLSGPIRSSTSGEIIVNETTGRVTPATPVKRRGRPPGKTKGGNQRKTVTPDDMTDRHERSEKELFARSTAVVTNADKRRCSGCKRTFMSASLLVNGICPPCRSK